MRRFRIRGLMGFVVVVAVATTALRYANDAWAGGLLLGSAFLLGVGLIAGVCGRADRRAGRLGFAILGGAYFAMAFVGLNEGNLARLPTSKLILMTHEQVIGWPDSAVSYITFTAPGMTTRSARSYATSTVTSFNGTSTFGIRNGNLVVTPAKPNRWMTMLPGAANFEAFSTVGHCLFAMIAGVLGSLVARWFARSPQAASPAAE